MTMRKVLLMLFVILLSGCNLNTLFLGGEINKVMVVKYTPYMKHHRAYFARNNLEKIRGKKYLFLHNYSSNDLAILFRYKNKYMLYNMSKPKLKPYVTYTKPSTTLKNILKSFRHKGFHPIHNLSSKGYLSSVSKRRYKGIKTLLIETRDYSHLQSLYKRAIKNYNAKSILSIKTRLPKSLIAPYYIKYKKKVKTKAQLAQLLTIGRKLYLEKKSEPKQKKHIVSKQPSKKMPQKKSLPQPTPTQETPLPPLEEPVQEEQIVPEIVAPVTSTDKPYDYYLHEASLGELSSYISNKATKNSLSYNQYTALSHKKQILEEERLFNEGSLEELIAAYKINKNAKYKKRIMLLMKEQQKNH